MRYGEARKKLEEYKAALEEEEEAQMRKWRHEEEGEKGREGKGEREAMSVGFVDTLKRNEE